ncbi:SpoIIE family protein phosphatase [Amorphus sp. 3PC139-8]|uniref:SpoIIE family protein phosphatase n=1 Tax=Amorphus sp. 3PC139-8 TaxID=2735676 RepID=UPI00345D1CA7
MLLRTRITLLLSIAFLLVIAGLVAIGFSRIQIERERLSQIAINGQDSVWRSVVEEQTRELHAIAFELSSRIDGSASGLSRDAIGKVVAASHEVVADAHDIQVVDPSGNILFSSSPELGSLPLLSSAAIDQIATTRKPIGGLRQDGPRSYVIASAVPVIADTAVAAIVTVTRDAEDALDRFSQAIHEPSFLVSLRGRMVEGTAPMLWDKVQPEVSPREAGVQVLRADDRLLFATGMPVVDMIGGFAGTLVTLRDATDSLTSANQLQGVGLVGIAIFAVVVLILLYLYMRHAFRPLEHAISVLEALSKGNLHQTLDETGSGEIRKISEAVAVFRRNAIALEENRSQVERQRRRQERIIRRQLERLADTLETDGRAEIVDDLQAAVRRRQDEAAGGRGGAQDDQLNVLATVLQRMSARISDQHTRLTALVKELQEAIITRAKLAGLEQELEIARELQLSFLPHPLPPHSTFAIHGVMETAKEVGGDFFDYFMIDERHLAVAAADVSGKGVPAAMFMAITRTLVKATAVFTNSPADSISQVNQFMAADNEQMMFVTLFYGVLDLETGILTYTNAGHNPPYIIKPSGGTARPLERTGDPALAIVEDHDYRELTVTLAPGDTLFAFTDGVTEAFDADGEAYGEGRLEALLAERAAATDVNALGGVVTAALLEFERGADRADDVTCLTLRYFGPETIGSDQTPSQSSGGGLSA